MTSFFDPPGPETASEEPESGRPPDWAGPPAWTAPGVVALELVLAHNDQAAILLSTARAWPTGVEFELRLLARGDLVDQPSAGFPHVMPGDTMRFGLLLADGRRVTNAELDVREDEEMAGEPVLMAQESGGGPDHWVERLWLWPLPTPGPLVVVCDWQSAGIPETRVELDSGRLRAAAERAHVIWVDDRPVWADDEGGGWVR